MTMRSGKDIDSLTLTPFEASQIVGINRFQLESWLKQGNCPFGVYIKKEGNLRGHYVIYRARLEAYVKGSDMKPST
jgi:hypothetical protein